MSKTYEQGVHDGIKLWAKACGNTAECEGCPISQLAGTGLSCHAFCQQFPGKAASLFKEMVDSGISYVEEYRTRFPSCELDAEAMYQNGMCRKLIFEGDNSCNGGDCVKCWNTIMGSEEEDGE